MNIDLFILKFGKSHVIQASLMDFRKWLTINLKDDELNTEQSYLFFDPPYEKVELYEELFEYLRTHKFLGRVIIEACQQKTMKIEDFEAKFGESIKQYKKGTSYFLIYKF